ncbi:MAG: SusD/RagB family nutrient-binding outer membrane lipoprotein [Carboxylicivirga sp.]|nr:SusD/RagB family nutrient-binding outer membrane lipoprotein [Carboxylicivirga sp.]
MKSKIIITLTICLIVFGGLQSCDYEEINTPQFQASEEDLKGDNFSLGAFFPNLQDVAYPAQENSYQMNENLIGDVYGRYMMTTKDAWSEKTFDVYKAGRSWYGFPFNSIMVGTYTAWNEIKNRTNGEGINFAWAQILRVASMHRITDLYGPIPYTNVESGDLKVAYDSQEDVYKQFFEDLDSAIEVLTGYVAANPGAKPMAQYDGVYDGDFRQWVMFANSLRLRLAMRVRYADAELAKTNAEAAVNHVYGVIKDNADNADYIYSKGNPIEVMWDDYKDTRACADIVSYLKGYQDPRLAKYFQNSTIADHENEIIGFRSGATLNVNEVLKYSAPAIYKPDPLMWMNAAEVTFLRAEGALLGWNMGGTAQELYNEGIKLSFQQWGASGFDTYILDETNLQADYDDPLGGNSTAAVSDITIKWDESQSEEIKLERIITQKYLALYPLGQEAWSEHRRTGYPKFFNLARTTTPNIPVANRIPFSYSEYENNSENLNEAINLLGGDDNYETKLWWDKKN